MTTIAVSFAIYTLIVAAFGFYSNRYAKPTESDFLLADRGLGAWVAAFSAAASAESGWVTMGLVGAAYKFGVGVFWIAAGTFLAFLFNWYVLAWPLREAAEKRQSLTVPDVIAARFPTAAARWIRLVGIVIILVMLTAYVAAQLNAAGKMFHGAFGISNPIGILIGGAIVLVYTIVGGFRAIAWTDVLQGALMVIAAVVLPIMLVTRIGGPSELFTELQGIDEKLVDPFAGNSGWAIVAFLVLWLGVPLGNPGQPHVLVRFMAIRNRRAVLIGGIVSSIWVLFLFCGAITLGLAARAWFAESGGLEDPEKAMVLIAQDGDLVPGILGGIIIAAILAAICSTADSQLLVAAAAISQDWLVKLRGYKGNLAAKLRIDRLAVVGVGLVALGIALQNVESIFSFVLGYGWAGLGAGFAPALLASLFWKRASGWGVLAGMIVGPSTAILWKAIPMLNEICYGLPIALLASTVALVATSLLTPDPPTTASPSADK